jgi:hypothetical protein
VSGTEDKSELYYLVTIVGGIFGPLLCFGIATAVQYFEDDTWFVNLFVAWEMAALVAWLGVGGRSRVLDAFIAGVLCIGALASLASLIFVPLGCVYLTSGGSDRDGLEWVDTLGLLGLVPPVSLVAYGWNTKRAMASLFAHGERLMPWICFALGAFLTLELAVLAKDSSALREAWQSVMTDIAD